MPTTIGVDVSKLSLACIQYTDQPAKLKQIPNQVAAIQHWIKQLPTDAIVVFEPTGSYSDKLHQLLDRAQCNYRLVSPYQSRCFARLMGQSHKTDAQDALTLAQMGQKLTLSYRPPLSPKMQHRQQIQRTINALQKQRQQLRNQLEALQQRLIIAPEAQQALQQTLAVVDQQVQNLQEQLNDYSDEQAQQTLKLMTSVVGIGDKTAWSIIETTNCLQDFDSDRKLVKFFGLAPQIAQSGTSLNQPGHISRAGSPRVRSNLWMAAKSAKRFNPQCKELYERMHKKGKPHKVIMVAIMNKLLRQVFAVVKSGKPYDRQYRDKQKK